MKFSERDYEIIRRAVDGALPMQIHAVLGGSKRHISVVMCRARKAGLLPPWTPENGASVYVTPDVAAQLRCVAAERGLTVNALALALLSAVVDHDLFDAVLG